MGYWLRCASNQASQALSLRVEDLGVTLAEWVVLRELYDGGRRPSALADKLGLTRSAISRLAQRLVAKLLITQDATAGEGRGQMLSLTDSGRVLVPVLAMRADVNDREFFGHLDLRTRALIVSTLREIVRRRGSRAAPAD
jgi:DNA-binding MarR family transcriptional regulator